MVSLFAFQVEASMTDLPVVRIVQRGRTCWAAAATAILGLYNMMPDARAAHGGDTHYIGLCEAINEANAADGKFQNTGTECCQYWYGEVPAEQDPGGGGQCTHGGGPGGLFNLYGINYTSLGRAATAVELLAEINMAQRPMAADWDFPSIPDHHWVAITGYDPSTNEICIMNGWDDGHLEGGHWCAPYADILGGRPGDDWTWTNSWTITNNRVNNLTANILNAPELVAGATSGVTPEIDANPWWFYLNGNTGRITIGPYIFGDGAASIISTTHNSYADRNIVIQPGTRILEGASILFQVGP
jgi:hypothetical protein